MDIIDLKKTKLTNVDLISTTTSGELSTGPAQALLQAYAQAARASLDFSENRTSLAMSRWADHCGPWAVGKVQGPEMGI